MAVATDGPSEKFPHKSVVWAKMEGFPWWPGHVVRRGEVALDSGEDEPKLGKGRVLVEFFYDNKRFASMKEKNVRHLMCSDHKTFRAYSGTYVHELRNAVIEAEDFYGSQKLRMAKKDGNAKSPSMPSSPTSPVADVPDKVEDAEPVVEQDLDVSPAKAKTSSRREPTRKASTKKRKKQESSNAAKGEVEVADKARNERKREKSIELGAEVAEDDGVEASRRSGRKVPRKRKRVEKDAERRVRSKSPLSGEEHEKGKVSEPEKRSTGKRKGRDVDVKDPVPVPSADILDEPVPRAVKKKRERKEESRKPVGQPTRKRERLSLPVKGEPKAIVVDMKEASPSKKEDLVSEKGGDAYLSLRKEEVVRLLHKRDDDIRAMRVEVWSHRFKNFDDSSIIKDSKALMEMCSPIFEKVEKFIEMIGEKHRTVSEERSKDRVLAESEAIQAVTELKNVHFDVMLLKSTKLGSRLFNLVNLCRERSSSLWVVLRDLLVQWVDILTIAPSSVEDDESGGREHETVEDSIAEAVAPAQPIKSDAPMPAPASAPANDKPLVPIKKSEGEKKRSEESKEPDRAETPKESENSKSGSINPRAKNITPEKVRASLEQRLNPLIALLDDVSVDDTQLAEVTRELEKAVFPTWKEDYEGYYAASLKVMKCVGRAKKFYSMPRENRDTVDPGPSIKALVSCLQKVEEFTTCIKLCVSDPSLG